MRTLSRIEYKCKLGYDSCPKCGSHRINYSERTKGSQVYKIYSCADCKIVIKREYV